MEVYAQTINGMINKGDRLTVRGDNRQNKMYACCDIVMTDNEIKMFVRILYIYIYFHKRNGGSIVGIKRIAPPMTISKVGDIIEHRIGATYFSLANFMNISKIITIFVYCVFHMI